MYSDTDGITNTSNLREHYEQCIKDFPSLEYCINYVTEGTKKGDWHMASPYEIRHILMNKALINMSLGKINGELIADSRRPSSLIPSNPPDLFIAIECNNIICSLLSFTIILLTPQMLLNVL